VRSRGLEPLTITFNVAYINDLRKCDLLMYHFPRFDIDSTRFTYSLRLIKSKNGEKPPKLNILAVFVCPSFQTLPISSASR